VLWVARIIGIAAMGAGLLPIALGYLVAHYFTALAFDGQRIVIILSDPLQLGWNLFGTSGFEPNDTFIPGSIVWAVELVAVVGGHIMGAVFGHRAVMLGRAATLTAPAATSGGSRDPANRQTAVSQPESWGATTASTSARDMRLRQVPLAILMVLLTALTLWSLGQSLVHETAGDGPVGTIVMNSPVGRV